MAVQSQLTKTENLEGQQLHLQCFGQALWITNIIMDWKEIGFQKSSKSEQYIQCSIFIGHCM